MSGPLSGRTVFITGSERGIGKSIALAMARAGARVAAHYGNRHPGGRRLDGAIASTAIRSR